MKIELEDVQASTVVDILMHLAALIDPEDPDGPRDAFGRRDARLEAHLLTDPQFMMLRHPAYGTDDRDDVASELRVIASTVHWQLPPDALATWIDRRD